MDKEQVQAFALLITGMSYNEWARMRHAVEQKFASESGKVVLADPEALAKLILLEMQ